MNITLKRVYEKASRTDGTRVLVDRLWPRGLRKNDVALHAWLRELAPSDILRQWFHQHRDAWQLFRKRYLKELAEPTVSRALEELYRLAHGRKRLTLLFASKNLRYNNAVVLKELLEGMRKPPSGTGPGAARSLRSRQAQRMRV